MKRFLLLLLVFVLPLQMSWAAMHICEHDDRAGPAVVVQHETAGHGHEHASDEAHHHDAAAEHEGQDNCCASAQGCQGQHSLVGTSDNFMFFSPVSQHMAAAPPGFTELDPLTRIDRPRWRAA